MRISDLRAGDVVLFEAQVVELDDRAVQVVVQIAGTPLAVGLDLGAISGVVSKGIQEGDTVRGKEGAETISGQVAKIVRDWAIVDCGGLLDMPRVQRLKDLERTAAGDRPGATKIPISVSAPR